MKLVENGSIDQKIMDFLLNNVRTPVEREGDFAAQIMANITGVRRTEELIGKYGLGTVRLYAGSLMEYAERLTRITIQKDGAILDFSRSDPQVQGSVNAVYAITLSAVLYVFRSLVSHDIPTNAGCLRPIKVLTKKGTVVDALFPAAVAGGNVELSQRIVDVVMGALSGAIPETTPAASQGTMNNVTVGGMDPRKGQPFAYYETIGGGMGASAGCNGESAVHCHMTNTLNTPVEALEYSYPFLVTEYSVRRGTGGNGRYIGGDGIVREIELLS
ncbi:MAG: hydantoinase B/oxoprolinase family protein, partial [Desulfobacterales bacterium]